MIISCKPSLSVSVGDMADKGKKWGSFTLQKDILNHLSSQGDSVSSAVTVG